MKFIGPKYNAVAYDITDNGIDEVMKTTRVRILEELKSNANLTQFELKELIGASVSPMMSRLRKDKEIERTPNQNRPGKVIYTITQKGHKYLNDYNKYNDVI